MSAAISHRALEAMGWRRVDPRPWGKLQAVWIHEAGWTLRHCGHPTALWPWALYAPDRAMVLTGAKYSGNPAFGTAWPTLRDAAEFVRSDRPSPSRGP